MSDDQQWDRPIAASVAWWRAAGHTEQAVAVGALKSMLRAHRSYSAQADALLAPLGLTEARYEVLLTVYQSDTGALGHGEIARRLQVSPAAVTGAVDKLQRSGYVSRRELATDRRHKRASLTVRGREIVREASDRMSTAIFARTGLSEQELLLLGQLLGRLGRSLGTARTEPASNVSPA